MVKSESFLRVKGSNLRKFVCEKLKTCPLGATLCVFCVVRHFKIAPSAAPVQGRVKNVSVLNHKISPVSAQSPALTSFSNAAVPAAQKAFEQSRKTNFLAVDKHLKQQQEI